MEKNTKYHTDVTVHKSNRGNIDTPNSNTYPLTFPAWYTHFNNKHCRVESALWTQSSPLSEISTCEQNTNLHTQRYNLEHYTLYIEF
jgi:hypothetical protein